MQLIEDLKAEHELIEQVVGSLRTFVTARLADQGDPEDGARFLAFFRRYAGDFHHDKEEVVLFRALVERAELPLDRGPIAALTGEHRRMGGLLDAMEGLLEPACRPSRWTTVTRFGATSMPRTRSSSPKAKSACGASTSRSCPPGP